MEREPPEGRPKRRPPPRCWPMGIAAANAAPRCGARTKSTRQPCQSPAMRNGRCHKHGGPSTGPRTPEGRARCIAAPTKHGLRSAEARARATERGKARAAIRDLNRLVANVTTGTKPVVEDK
jgi:hypothetical protein